MWIIILVVLIALAIVFIFNNLIRYKMLMEEAWSGIDVQLKRRHDLIPNILEAVKGYAQHERRVMEEVTSIRSKLMNAQGRQEKSELENSLSSGLKTIFALAEAYPDLKADRNFLELQKSLTEVEDQIQMARRYYNGTARNYNILAQTFPSNIVTGIFNFKKAEFFEIEYATERLTPEVKFGG